MPSPVPIAELICSLPAQEAKSFAAWVAQIADEANGKPIDWSTAWSDEDLADALAASLRTFEEAEAGGGTPSR